MSDKKGNTTGRVSGETPSTKVAASKANPSVTPEAEEKGVMQGVKDDIDKSIDKWVESKGDNKLAMAAGALGIALNEVFTPTALWEIIPVGKLLKIAKKGGEVVGLVKKGDNAVDAAKATKKAPEVPKAEKPGGKVKPRPKKRVKCFCVQDDAKGGRGEYDKQLKRQQDGINSMSANEYLAERKSFTGKDPCNGYSDTGDGKTKKRNPKVTKSAKAERLEAQKDKYFREMRDKGIGRDDARRLSTAKASREIGGQDALHNQDMVAGGKDAIGALKADGSRALGDGDFGLSDTNRHIGSQWNGERIQSIDAEACQAQKDGQGDEKMNTELRPCGKHEAKAAGCKQKKRK